MHKILIFSFVASFVLVMSCSKSKFDFKKPETYPVYNGNDLGVTWSPDQTIFKIWAPTASSVVVRIYNQGDGGEVSLKTELEETKDGVWEGKVNQNLLNQFYTFQIKVNGKWMKEVPGPDAIAAGVNGKRGQIVNLSATNPTGWENDSKPLLKSFNDIVLYETHIRDFSIHPKAGFVNKGKYLAFTETGLKLPNGQAIGVDHLKEMGITHLHLLPAFDFRSVDESQLDKVKYNWGYDPQNFNVPDGSFSTNPNDGNIRIKEFKLMVQALHQNGIRVIMDVVYNHVGDINNQSFEQTVPGYYFRHNTDGSLSNATGCGNETASERPMVQNYIVSSVKYWAKEYHIDGFRFDLMGVHDTATMNRVARELHAIDSTLFVYGEGWTAGDSPLPEGKRAVKANMTSITGVAVFSDEIRDGIKGHWSNVKEKGFASGAPDMEPSVMFGIVGATQHPQVDYDHVNNSKAHWANKPDQCINYVSCHDNNTLWDKLAISCPESSVAERKRMDRLANTIVMTSQGIPFLHAGVEFLRSKQLIENSFESPDSINWIDWRLKDVNYDQVQYYKDLIKLRKDHPAFRMPTTNEIANNLEFLDLEPGLIGYIIWNHANNDPWGSTMVIFNGTKQKVDFDLVDDVWKLAFDIDNGYRKEVKKVTGVLKLDPVSAYVFYKD